MEHLILKDLEKGFVFYPGCGTNFDSITAVINRFSNKYGTFVLCDAGRPMLETVNRYHNVMPIDQFENRIGLAGLKTINTIEWSSFTDFINLEEIIDKLIKQYGKLYMEYVSTIFDKSFKRYTLKHGNHEFVLYFIKFEALAILNWLLTITSEKKIDSGVILYQSGLGWTDSDYTETLIKAYETNGYLPKFLVNDGYWWLTRFHEWEDINLGENRTAFLRHLNNTNY